MANEAGKSGCEEDGEDNRGEETHFGLGRCGKGSEADLEMEITTPGQKTYK